MFVHFFKVSKLFTSKREIDFKKVKFLLTNNGCDQFRRPINTHAFLRCTRQTACNDTWIPSYSSKASVCPTIELKTKHNNIGLKMVGVLFHQCSF